jgi:hypothetical protein
VELEVKWRFQLLWVTAVIGGPKVKMKATLQTYMQESCSLLPLRFIDTKTCTLFQD